MDRSTGRLVAARRRAPQGFAAGAENARLGIVAGDGAVHRISFPYVPFKWRGRWNSGRVRSGSVGVHHLDTAYWALDLGLPTTAEVVSTSQKTDDCPPLESTIEIQYPARGKSPPVKLLFYDGNRLPPTELFHGEIQLRQRFTDDRDKGHALYTHMARRRKRGGHVSAAAEKGIHWLHTADADAAADQRTPPGMDQCVQGRTADAVELCVRLKTD